MIGIQANNNVLTPEECEYLVSYLKGNSKWSLSPDPTWSGRIVELNDIDDALGASYMIKAYNKIKSSLPEEFDADSFAMVVWNEHTGANLHTDEVGFEWRKYSSIVYLNDDFTGGYTQFPEQGVSVEPRTGMGIVFEANDTYPHLVSEVTSGKRYTIASFWTKDEKHNFYKRWMNENSRNWL